MRRLPCGLALQHVKQQQAHAVHLKLLVHCASCTSCSAAHCKKMKLLMAVSVAAGCCTHGAHPRPASAPPLVAPQHGETCASGLQGGCSLCKRVRYLVETHAKQCKLQGRLCPVPHCADVKEQSRRSGNAQSAMDARRRAAQNAAKKDPGASAAAAPTDANATASSSSGGDASIAAAPAGGGASAAASKQASKGAGRSAAMQPVDFTRLRPLSDSDLAKYADAQARLAAKMDELLAPLAEEQRRQFEHVKESTKQRIHARIRQASQLAPDVPVPWDAERQHLYELHCYHEVGRFLTRLREEKERETTAQIYVATPADPAAADTLAPSATGGTGGASSTRGPPGHRAPKAEDEPGAAAAASLDPT